MYAVLDGNYKYTDHNTLNRVDPDSHANQQVQKSSLMMAHTYRNM
jgi:hypothetical protein